MRVWKGTVVLLIVVLSAGAACAQSQEPVRFAVHGATSTFEAYRALLERFTEETGIPAEVVPTGGSAIAGKWEQIVVWTAAGLSPDIVSGVSTEFGQYAINGMLTPLDPYIERDGVDMNQVLPAFADALKYDGKQYIMPYGSSGMVWMYNRDRFEMAGLPQPPANAGPDWTLDDLREAARRLTTWDGDRITAWGIAGWPTAEEWQTVPYAFGGRWLSDDLLTFLGTSEKTITAYETYVELAYEDQVLNPNGGQGGHPNFQSGRDGMAGVGTWIVPRMQGQPVNWDFMPWFQYEDEKPAGVLFPIGYGILSASQNKENAWELIKWLTFNAQANFDYAYAAGAIPSNVDNLVPWMEHQETIYGPDLRVEILAEQAQMYNAVIEARMTPAYDKIDPLLRATHQSIITRQQDARSALMSVESVINQMLREAWQ